MDLDARLRSLDSFKQRLERLFDGGALQRLEAAIAAIGEIDTTSAEELSKRVEDVAEHVAALEKRFDEVRPALDALPAQLAPLTDPAMVDLLDWLARSRQGLEVLLSLGETVDGAENSPSKPNVGAVDTSETSAPTEGADTGSGAQAGS